MADDPARFLPLGDLPLHVLLALGEGPAHWYAIGKEVELRSDGRLDPATGALYQALKRLTEAGLVAPSAQPAAETDARRKYFRITPLGRRVAAAEAERLAGLVALARAKRLYPSTS
jgi:DNA-binding PadR family transcriptional regulator